MRYEERNDGIDIRFIYLHEIKEQLYGKLTLSAVSDEERSDPGALATFSSTIPRSSAIAALTPSLPDAIRFASARKEPLWLRFTVRTHGAHGAYVHRSASATAIASKIIGELECLTELPPAEVGNLTPLFEAATQTVDAEWGAGAAHNLRRITVNPGLMRGGVKVNMVAAECVFEVDIRLPNGINDALIRKEVDAIVARYPEASYEQILYNPPNWTPPDTEMAELVRANAKAVSGIEPIPVVSLGCTDARLWRYADVPAIVFGPSPIEMGGVDEYVEVEEFLDVVRTHVLSAYDYLSRPSSRRKTGMLRGTR